MAKVLIVTADVDGFRRAGLSFGRAAVQIHAEDLDEVTIARLMGDPRLSVLVKDSEQLAALDNAGGDLGDDTELGRLARDYDDLRKIFDTRVEQLGDANVALSNLRGDFEQQRQALERALDDLKNAKGQTLQVIEERDDLQLALRTATDELADLKNQLADAKNNPPEAQSTNGGGDPAASEAAPPAKDTKTGKGPKSKA